MLDISTQANVMDKLVSATAKLQALERVAHGIDKHESEKDKRAVAAKQMTDVERRHRIEYLLKRGMARLQTPGGSAA